jgi:hypothetical protein
MAGLILRPFSNYAEATFFLRGGVSTTTIADAAPVVSPTLVYGLDGKTLVFTTPSATVTFSDPTGAGLSISEIADQIQTELTSTYAVTIMNRAIHIVKVAPAAIVLGGAGTANTMLGFPAAGVASVKYAAPDGVAPRLVWLTTTGSPSGTIVVTTEE